MLLHDGDVALAVMFMTEVRAPRNYTRSKPWSEDKLIAFRRDY